MYDHAIRCIGVSSWYDHRHRRRVIREYARDAQRGKAERNIETEKRQHKGESGHRSVNPRPSNPFLTRRKNESFSLSLSLFVAGIFFYLFHKNHQSKQRLKYFAKINMCYIFKMCRIDDVYVTVTLSSVFFLKSREKNSYLKK